MAMLDFAISPEARGGLFARLRSRHAILGILIGIIMPMVSAFLYPTYTHLMKPAWVEWTRLLEMPFVACEMAVIGWAVRRGMDSVAMWSSFPKDIKIASAMLLCGIFTSSIFISAFALESLTMALINVVHLLFALAVFYLLKQSSAHERSSILTLLGAGLISLAALTTWKFVLPPPLSEIPGKEIEWASALPGFISLRHFGSWTGAITAGFAAMLLYGDDNRKLSWPHFFYFLSCAMTVWSGTRAAVLAIVITTAILVLMRRKMPSFKAIGILSMLTGAAMTAAWFLVPYGDNAFLLFSVDDLANADRMTSGRLELWAATFQRWLDSPILGWGTGSIFWEVYVGWTHTQPHNVILQFLISWGLVGAAGALWLLFRAVLASHHVVLKQPALQPMLAVLYTLLLMSLVEGMLHYPRFIMLIMVMFAIVMAHAKNEMSENAAN